MKKILFAGTLALLVVSFQSCQKTDQRAQTSSSSLGTTLKAAVSEIASNSVLENSTQDIQGLCLEKFDGFGEAFRLNEGMMPGMGPMKFKMPHLSDCATITVSDTTFPKEITIDYGTGCADKHDHIIKGKIIINISDSLTKVGATKTIVSQDLYIDSVKIDLNTSFVNLGKNASGNWVLGKTGSQVVTLEDGTVISQTGEDTITWKQGFGTIDKSDDIFYKTGSGTINIDDSLVFSRKIITPLLIDRSCEFILSGVVELYKDGKTVSVDYGDGTCDSVATVTTDGTSEVVNLHTRGFNPHGKFGKHCPGHFGKGH